MTDTATRTEGLARLSAFLPKAGRAYAARRNHDLPGHPHVSRLSPYLRHRLLTEEEVLSAIHARHGADAAGKAIDEVFWRTYWKGWLEQRPGVWQDYRRGVRAALDRVATESGLRRDWEAACAGDTGIAAMDHWARELVETGYLHNHARMWFASIWIFTLRLPWELGADFFLRHLLDGDAASNTLSWRWVAGLQTPGKAYLARAENIARYTGGRFRPTGLDEGALPLAGPPPPPRVPLPATQAPTPGRPVGLILTEDDLAPGFVLDGVRPEATLVVSGVAGRSPLCVSDGVRAFTEAAIRDTLGRWGDRLGPVTWLGAEESIADWARAAGVTELTMAHAPVGPAADRLAGARAELDAAGLRLSSQIRPYDARAWPAATAGFFKFRKEIPRLLAALDRPAAA